jgi:hypothetical protein
MCQMPGVMVSFCSNVSTTQEELESTSMIYTILHAKFLRALGALERLLDLNFLSWFISPPVFNTQSTLHGSAVEVQELFI